MDMNGILKENNILKMKILFLLFICFFLAACGDSKPKARVVAANPIENDEQYLKSVRFSAPEKGAMYHHGDEVRIELEVKNKYPVDSIVLFLNEKRVAVSDTPAFRLILPEIKVGKSLLKVIVYHHENKRGIATQSIIVKPVKAPVKYDYSVVKVLPHDAKAYTQGLVYHDGYMYEGTGQYGESSVRKVDMKDNSILSVLNIDGKYFGEGIAIYKDKIYQITWTSRVGFVYDLATFTQESVFSYNTQGWGLTTIGDELVMSDGSNKLYYVSPSSFSIVREIEVFDNKGEVVNLNELEYIDGLIWANVWMTDRIVMIDPATGVVKGELNMAKLLPAAERNRLDDSDDVLNGIALNPEKGTVYLTGKRWPKMFEITYRPVGK